MPAEPQDAPELYDVYLGACLDGRAEDPDLFLSRHPGADTEARELVRALHREYAAGTSGSLPFERLGGYRLVRRLGVGGMGAVYLAEQESLGREVALKILRPELAGSETMLRRFKREAQAIARLRHPGIVSVLEFGEDHGAQFIAMEHVAGHPLDEILREGPVEPQRLLRWMIQVGKALAYAHERGVVHRDVKPSNVLITPDDRAVLLDFGIAYLTGMEASRLTQSFAGSPLYAAPEQIASGEVDARTDVYLLGVTTYEGLTGSLPFRGGTLENVFRRVLLEDATPPSRVNDAVRREVDVVLLKAMEKKPQARYPDMASLIADLEALTRSEPTVAKRPGALTRTRKWARRSPVRATIVAALVLAAVGVGAAMIHASAQRAAKRRSDAVELVGRARTVLAEYREARIANKDFDKDVQGRKVRLEARYLSAEADEQYEKLLDRFESMGVERDLMFSKVLELLQQAREHDRDVAGVEEVTAKLWLERVEEARQRSDGTAVRRFRAKVAEHDPDGRHTGDLLLRSGSIRIQTDPPGFAVYAFRLELQRELIPGGDRRLVPVPVGAEAPVASGTWTLRVVKGVGEVYAGDQILEVFGHRIQGTVLAADGHGPIQRGDRLVSIGDAQILLPIDVKHPEEEGPHLYVFERAGERIEVKWDRPPIALLSAQAMVAGGDVPARVHHDGQVREMVLPADLVVRTTAAPRFTSPACQVGRTPTDEVPLEPGRYVLVVRKPGYVDHVFHHQIVGGRQSHFEWVPNPVGAAPGGFVFISSGQREVGSFWILEHEITNGEYLEFLNDPETLARVDAAFEEARYILFPRHTSRNAATWGFWTRGADGRFVLPSNWGLRLPVMTITSDDARAYAHWRGGRDKQTYTLPTRRQWKLAGYGNTQTTYAFGDVFRPKWVSALTSRPGRRGFDPVMSFPIDESPTGVYDMSGSANEWVEWDGSLDSKGMSVGGSAMRGVAWEFALVALHPRRPEFAGGDVGFRLVINRGTKKDEQK